MTWKLVNAVWLQQDDLEAPTTPRLASRPLSPPRLQQARPLAVAASHCVTAEPVCADGETASAELPSEMADLVGELRVASRALEPPRLQQVEWRSRQRFNERSDPDRTLEPWDPPSFLRRKDPAAQSAKTSAEDLAIGKACGATGSSFAKVVHSVLDEEDCATLLACVNRKGFTPALVNIGRGSQQYMPEVRDGHRVIVDSPELSEWLLQVLRPHLPEEHAGAALVDLNERCRFLCYTPGQFFASHHDGRYTRPAQSNNAGDFSIVTVQLYLHDVPESHGGGTTFLTSREEPVAACQPGAGDALIFSQDLYHEGSVLQKGLKYTMRTEAMYRRTAQR